MRLSLSLGSGWMEVSVWHGEKEKGKVWECLIAGCVVIQEARNVSYTHISDLLSGGEPADRQQEAIQGYGSAWPGWLMSFPVGFKLRGDVGVCGDLNLCCSLLVREREKKRRLTEKNLHHPALKHQWQIFHPVARQQPEIVTVTVVTEFKDLNFLTADEATWKF